MDIWLFDLTCMRELYILHPEVKVWMLCMHIVLSSIVILRDAMWRPKASQFVVILRVPAILAFGRNSRQLWIRGRDIERIVERYVTQAHVALMQAVSSKVAGVVDLRDVMIYVEDLVGPKTLIICVAIKDMFAIDIQQGFIPDISRVRCR